jgi:ABC-type multidrug transport system fused ATPase/permease subunit
MPFILALLYLLQRFYLQTSRQMRLLMIEAKAPLYTCFTEVDSSSVGATGSSGPSSTSGATTIRAFGWQSFYQTRVHSLIDQAQRPAYLQNCIQNWLNFILNLMVAVLAVILIATVVAWRDKFDVNAGGIGISTIVLIGFNQTLTRVIHTWTKLESSVGAVARVKRFVTDTESEDSRADLQLSTLVDDTTIEWPQPGKIKLDSLVASYRYASP